MILGGAILVLLVGHRAWIADERDSKPSESVTPEVMPPVTVSETHDVPPLYPSVSWEDPPPDRFSLGAGVVVISENGHPLEYRSLGGREWYATFQTLSADHRSPTREFADYYDSTLPDRGWVPELVINGVELKVVEGAGPQGGAWGYLKRIGDDVRAVALYYGVRTQPDRRCPCIYTFQILLTDKIAISDLVAPSKGTAEEE